MAMMQSIENFKPLEDARLLDKAEKWKPELCHSKIAPVGAFCIEEEESGQTKTIDLEALPQLPLGKGDQMCIDFGTHYVGYVTLDISYTGSHPDAPAFLKLEFAENKKELFEDTSGYEGWISSSWIQEDYLHIDVLPAIEMMPRRYAFRYVKITVLDTSPKYKVTINQVYATAVSAVRMEQAEELSFQEPLLGQIYKAGIRTLHDCMQDVFEDGPKRDQRLWAGDLRLQAQANYATFRNNGLVKRCLYLFAGSRFPDGRVSACLFTRPNIEADDTWMFDYSLFYVVMLEEYLEQTEDQEALEDLYGIAQQQIDMSVALLDEKDVVTKQAVDATFIDWSPGLEKAACAQAVLIYTLRYAKRLADRKGEASRAGWLEQMRERLIMAAKAAFWNEELKCFLANGQASAASQIWMVLADVVEKEQAAQLMRDCEKFIPNAQMTTPYMHHYYVMALLKSGLSQEALEHIRTYWGGMIKAGADTFWEAFVPEDPDASPYGGCAVNSYCHAWSCTPAYILKKYFI